MVPQAWERRSRISMLCNDIGTQVVQRTTRCWIVHNTPLDQTHSHQETPCISNTHAMSMSWFRAQSLAVGKHELALKNGGAGHTSGGASITNKTHSPSPCWRNPIKAPARVPAFADRHVQNIRAKPSQDKHSAQFHYPNPILCAEGTQSHISAGFALDKEWTICSRA